MFLQPNALSKFGFFCRFTTNMAVITLRYFKTRHMHNTNRPRFCPNVRLKVKLLTLIMCAHTHFSFPKRIALTLLNLTAKPDEVISAAVSSCRSINIMLKVCTKVKFFAPKCLLFLTEPTAIIILQNKVSNKRAQNHHKCSISDLHPQLFSGPTTRLGPTVR